VFDLYSDEQEIDFAYDDVFKMVFALVILELDVKAILNSNFHFDAEFEVEEIKRETVGGGKTGGEKMQVSLSG